MALQSETYAAAPSRVRGPALPAGPRLPATIQTLLYLTRPAEFLLWCRKRYGDTFTLDTLLFGVEVAIANPEDVKRVFTGDPDVLHAGEANELLGALVGRRSVLLLDGPEHLRQRRLMMPPFHGERMQAYAVAMQDATVRAVREDLPAGRRATPLHPVMQRITLEVIVRTIFGAEDPDEMRELEGALARVVNRLGSGVSALVMLPALRFELWGLSPWAAFQRDLAAADALIHAQIARRRRGEGAREDVLAMLLLARDEAGQPMTDAELRDELMTLLVAGHETTATMLCWAFDLVLSHPSVRDRLVDEIRSAPKRGELPAPDEIARLPYLDAVIKEVLRLRPVIPAVGRKLTAPMTLRGRTFPKGTLLVPSSYLVHHDAALYPEPGAFRPERFLDKKPDPYAFFPFGGGVRRCLGMAFALYELKIVTATILSQLSLRKADPKPSGVRARTFTFAPERGVRVTVH